MPAVDYDWECDCPVCSGRITPLQYELQSIADRRWYAHGAAIFAAILWVTAVKVGLPWGVYLVPVPPTIFAIWGYWQTWRATKDAKVRHVSRMMQDATRGV